MVRTDVLPSKIRTYYITAEVLPASGRDADEGVRYPALPRNGAVLPFAGILGARADDGQADGAKRDLD